MPSRDYYFDIWQHSLVNVVRMTSEDREMILGLNLKNAIKHHTFILLAENGTTHMFLVPGLIKESAVNKFLAIEEKDMWRPIPIKSIKR